MHPSDVRLTPWTDADDAVGTSPALAFPAAQWKNVNNDTRITFTLTAAQAAAANTLRIGVTDAVAGGRPQITVNGGTSHAWWSALPASSSQPDSRSITRGTYRGNNVTFLYDIPVWTLTAGTNAIDIYVNGGSSGPGFLSPAIVYDAVDLVPTSTPAATTATVATPTSLLPAPDPSGALLAPTTTGASATNLLKIGDPSLLGTGTPRSLLLD